MLILGAGGLASQLFDDLIATKQKVFFWSETETAYSCIKDHYKILQTEQEVINHFKNTSPLYVAGIWNIDHRRRLTEKFNNLGGELSTFITPYSYLSIYTSVGRGSIVLHKASSEPGVTIGENCIVNKRANFGHGCTISSFCSIGPYSIIGSDAELGENCYVGMGAIIQPKVKIGKNVIISAGAVVTKNMPDNSVVDGVPARIRFLRKK